jgi:hypothetical protein
MVDRLADPLLSGVYGGEAASLSVRAVLPRFAEMERTHGSLGRAMLAARKKMPRPANKPAAPLFTSLKNGMQQLVEVLVPRLNPSPSLPMLPCNRFSTKLEAGPSSPGPKTPDHFDAVNRRPAPLTPQPDTSFHQPRALRRTRRHRLQLFHHRWSRLRSRSPPVAPARLRISRPAQ